MSFENDEQLAAQAVQEQAYEEAVRLLRPLAERNSEYALVTLGWIYEWGAVGCPDAKAARSFYEQAVSEGSGMACRYLGGLLLRSGHEAEARAAFERGARRNDEECKSELLRLDDYANEKEAARLLEAEDFHGAAELLRPLAGRDSEYALRCLGWIYETGQTGAPDIDAARSCYLRAAALGSGPAQYDLGRFLEAQGSEIEARAAYQSGATQGDIPSMSKLGKMLIRGHGGPTEAANGWAWLEKAAGEGHIWARRELLAIEEDNAGSVFEKLAVKVKILRLAFSGARQATKDPQSDMIR